MDEAQRSYHNEQSQLCEKRPVWAFLGIRPGAGQRAHCVILLHSCKALIMSACSCACSDFARSEQAVS